MKITQEMLEEQKNIPCPICGDEYKGRKGVQSHSSLSHGAHVIIWGECGVCGREIAVNNKDKDTEIHVCSEECHKKHLSQSRQGEKHHNYGRDYIEKVCSWCGDEYSDYGFKRVKFCSRVCMEQAAADFIENSPMEDHPRYNQVEVECEFCGGALYRCGALVEKHDKFFCNNRCRGDWQRETPSVSWHPAYSDVHHETYYGSEWQGIRKKIRKRDDYTCVNCAREEEDMVRELDVHHLTPYRHFKDGKEAHTDSNLVTLCRSCHMSIESTDIELEEIR